MPHPTALRTPSTGIWCDLDGTGFWGIQIGSTKYPAIYTRPSEARAALAALTMNPAGAVEVPTTQPVIAIPTASARQAAAQPLDDPTMPFGVLGGPSPDGAITQAALDQALAHIEAYYLESPLDCFAVLKRATKARAVLRTPDRWRIRPDGAVEVHGSSDWYLVADAEHPCVLRDRRTKKGGVKPCPDATFRGGLTGNTCYHQFCRELLRLAQVLTTPPVTAPFSAVCAEDFATTEAPPSVDLTLPAGLFVRAWNLIACTDLPTQIAINGDALLLLAGGVQVILSGQGSEGTVEVAVSAPTVCRVQHDLTTVVPTTLLTVTFDRVTDTLLLLSDAGSILSVLS